MNDLDVEEEQGQAVVVKHPAKFSDPILDVMAGVLRDRHVTGLALDPMAGVGKVHLLVSKYGLDLVTVGVELEREWADQHPATIHGSCMDLAAHGFADGEVAAIIVSPTYANRMADKHNPSPADTSTRHTYKHYLGRDLSDGSSAGLQWGPGYRDFHRAAWTEIVRVLEPGGLFVLNISDHVRQGKVVPVTAWHKATLRGLGVEWVDAIPVATRRQKHGANAGARVECEWVLVGRKK